MKAALKVSVVLIFLVAFQSHASSDQGPAMAVAKHCKTELVTYCHDVTPGEGRILSCLHAYSDKLSNQCSDVVHEIRQDLKLMASALNFVQGECGADVERLCKNVVPGGGRILNCLEENDAQVSQRCKFALKDVGLKD